jgi:hypothetical protein
MSSPQYSTGLEFNPQVLLKKKKFNLKSSASTWKVIKKILPILSFQRRNNKRLPGKTGGLSMA